MSKQRRPPNREVAPEGATDRERAPGSADTEHAARVGNQALQALIGVTELSRSAEGPASSASELATRAATALRVAPPDPDWSERLVAIVSRSALPVDRREAIVDRLRGDQAVAESVASVVEAWLGADTEAGRSALIGAIDQVAGGSVGAAESELAERVSRSLGPEAPTPVAIEGLVRQLALLVHLVWDEDEEIGPAGDYAAEESGF